jgi:SAM-dependent methyltransferase
MLFSQNNPVPTDEFALLKPILHSGLSMLELGNKKNRNGVYKTYFESMDIRHVSIDWNGKDGAFPLDLRDKSNLFINNWYDSFDIVTNFGTTEHVIPQCHVWDNILNFVKVGGYIVSVTPIPGDWTWHQKDGRYPTKEFYEDLAKNNGLVIETLYQGKHAPRRLNYVRMKKTRPITDPQVNKDLIEINA